MKSKLRTLTYILGATLLFASNCVAQKVPVRIQSPSLSVNEDQTAVRFTKSLSDEIQLSGKFYYWDGKSSEFPANGVTITVRSVQVKFETGEVVGSAIFVEASLASGKDPDYSKVVAERMWMIPKDDPVGDDTRSFLAEVNRRLERK